VSDRKPDDNAHDAAAAVPVTWLSSTLALPSPKCPEPDSRRADQPPARRQRDGRHLVRTYQLDRASPQTADRPGEVPSKVDWNSWRAPRCAFDVPYRQARTALTTPHSSRQISRSAPVMKLESSDARNSAPRATSSGSPSRAAPRDARAPLARRGRHIGKARELPMRGDAAGG
jgi:hypothetical protein